MTKTELAKEIVEKYIDIALRNNKQFSKRYIATVLYNEHPEIFKDVEDARCVIRYAVGSAGNKNRKVKSTEEIARQFALIPEQIREVETTAPFVVPTSIKKCLMIADVHGRFYNRQALEIAINYGIKQGCDSVIIDGDWQDFYGHSKFDKNPSISIILEEKEWSDDMLELLQNTFGYVVHKSGNHDVRRERHIERLSATMPEMMEFSRLEDYLFFDGCTTHFVKDYQFIEFGKLNIIHGHEYYGSGGQHVAHNRFNKALDNILSAHSHKPQSVIRPNIKGEIYGSWALGCLCDLHPRYSPMNDWSNGFAVVEKDGLGDFNVDNRVIMGTKTFAV